MKGKMKDKDYFAHSAYSASDLLMYQRSPMLLADSRAGLVRRTESPAMSLGTAIHAALLEPHRIRITPAQYESKDGLKPWNNDALVCRAWNDAAHAEDAVVISERQAVDIALMLKRTPSRIRALLSLPTEVCVFANMGTIELRCKCDILDVDGGVIYDLKTISSLDDIDKNIRTYQYHLRAEFYKRVLKLSHGKPFEFIMLFVESGAPYRWQFVRLSGLYQALAWREVSTLIERLEQSHLTGDFTDARELESVAEIASWQLELDDIV